MSCVILDQQDNEFDVIPYNNALKEPSHIESNILTGANLYLTSLDGLLDHLKVYVDTNSSQSLRVLSVFDESINLSPHPCIKHLHIKVKDEDDEDLESFFPECCTFIQEAMNIPNATVIVHCGAGISRSASVIIAYLIKTRLTSRRGTAVTWGFDDSISFVKSKRRFINPNDGFVMQLKSWESLIFLQCSI